MRVTSVSVTVSVSLVSVSPLKMFRNFYKSYRYKIFIRATIWELLALLSNNFVVWNKSVSLVSSAKENLIWIKNIFFLRNLNLPLIDFWKIWILGLVGHYTILSLGSRCYFEFAYLFENFENLGGRAVLKLQYHLILLMWNLTMYSGTEDEKITISREEPFI